MSKQGNHTLPDVGIMLASKEVRHREATDTEIVGRARSTEEEEEPRGLQILHSRSAVGQQTTGGSQQSTGVAPRRIHPNPMGCRGRGCLSLPLVFQIAEPKLRLWVRQGVQLQAVRRDQVARIRHGSRFVSCQRGFGSDCDATGRPATDCGCRQLAQAVTQCRCRHGTRKDTLLRRGGTGLNGAADAGRERATSASMDHPAPLLRPARSHV